MLSCQLFIPNKFGSDIEIRQIQWHFYRLKDTVCLNNTGIKINPHPNVNLTNNTSISVANWKYQSTPSQMHQVAECEQGICFYSIFNKKNIFFLSESLSCDVDANDCVRVAYDVASYWLRSFNLDLSKNHIRTDFVTSRNTRIQLFTMYAKISMTDWRPVQRVSRLLPIDCRP